MDAVQIAIVGAGGIARKHVAGLAEIDHARITAVVDTLPENATNMANAHNATAYARLEECLPDVDMVYILTPPSFHRELAVLAMEAGKHVVVEKPIAIDLADAEAMVETAERTHTKLMIGFNMRFRNGFRRLKETLDSGQLGDPLNVWSQRLGIGVGSGNNWRTTPELLCGMSIESLSHDIDMIEWLAGRITHVSAQVAESRADLPGFDDNANIVFSLENGAIASIQASWSSHIPLNSRGIVGTHGTAMITGRGLWDATHFHLKTTSMTHEQIEVLNEPLDYTSYREENRHFIDCVRQNRMPEITGEDGLRALRISHAVLTSSREKRTICVNSA